MSSLVSVNFHASQFPHNVRQDLLDSLKSRKVHHKFHYDSIKQTTKWLALHQAYSPSRTDPDCATTYDRAFEGTVARITAPDVRVIGLGCGGGHKDTRLLQLLRRAEKAVAYVPCDVSSAMVLEARRHARGVLPDLACVPLVCDLGQANDLGTTLDELCEGLDHAGAKKSAKSETTRFYTFFGMIPNFEAETILPRLAEVLGPADQLLLSANLAPGSDYVEGIRQILPLYDNDLTWEWLITFLLDLGVEREDGEMSFRIEEDPKSPELKRIAAYFRFNRFRQLKVDGEPFSFQSGEEVRLFFSYRYTPALLQSALSRHGLSVSEQWVTRSGEEGVFWVTREP